MKMSSVPPPPPLVPLGLALSWWNCWEGLAVGVAASLGGRGKGEWGLNFQSPQHSQLAPSRPSVDG